MYVHTCHFIVYVRECMYVCSWGTNLFLPIDECEGNSLTSMCAIIVGGELLDWLCHVCMKNEQELEKIDLHFDTLAVIKYHRNQEIPQAYRNTIFNIN